MEQRITYKIITHPHKHTALVRSLLPKLRVKGFCLRVKGGSIHFCISLVSFVTIFFYFRTQNMFIQCESWITIWHRVSSTLQMKSEREPIDVLFVCLFATETPQQMSKMCNWRARGSWYWQCSEIGWLALEWVLLERNRQFKTLRLLMSLFLLHAWQHHNETLRFILQS
jgi:hypothetical protein